MTSGGTGTAGFGIAGGGASTVSRKISVSMVEALSDEGNAASGVCHWNASIRPQKSDGGHVRNICRRT